VYRLPAWLFSLSAIFLAACENFDYTFNERVVFTTRELFRDFEVADAALHDCITQTIADSGISAAGQLTDLNCSNAGITDLDGLAQFNGLLRLRLSSNAVRNLVELQALVSLRELYLDDNRIVDPVPLYSLPALRFLELSRNPGLQCPASSGLLRVETVVLPAHCRRAG
jgi:internalin A